MNLIEVYPHKAIALDNLNIKFYREYIESYSDLIDA